jgi:cytochrome c-type biogenesis protein CcmH
MSRSSTMSANGPGSGRRDRTRPSVGAVVLAIALLAGGAALAVVAMRGPAPPASMADRVRTVAVGLRCPVCQSLSVADSPSRLAQEMRRTIARDLRAGKSQGEIREAFATAYGSWVLESPPKRGIDLVAWIAPALLLGSGLAVAAWSVWRWSLQSPAGVAAGHPAHEDQPLSVGDRSLLDRAMAAEPEDLP